MLLKIVWNDITKKLFSEDGNTMKQDNIEDFKENLTIRQSSQRGSAGLNFLLKLRQTLQFISTKSVTIEIDTNLWYTTVNKTLRIVAGTEDFNQQYETSFIFDFVYNLEYNVDKSFWAEFTWLVMWQYGKTKNSVYLKEENAKWLQVN